jgi:hypothetical protein
MPLPDAIQVTLYLRKDDLTFLLKERERLQAKGNTAFVHSSCVGSAEYYALWRTARDTERTAKCWNCEHVWHLDIIGDAVIICPRCRGGENDNSTVRIHPRETTPVGMNHSNQRKRRK